ncbi:putative lipoate-protein ligase [Candidatus Vecturithrix granuli]|uniref:Putative lipoate-protein ligase n=1 Tax=Vecturithrix granuli TaxID=1499967 RepID=A0A081C074_VECG1|nr:putative lipoate-protein ligase [Candidatus Vecturithrix granuli]
MSVNIIMNFDEDLIKQVKEDVTWTYRSWEPEQIVVVLGRGNQAEREVCQDRCQDDHIPIIRRRGGGGTVVLSPGTLVISLVKRVQHQYHFHEYFQQINTYIIEALESLGIKNLNQQGYSDICIRDRKILGSSMYRSRDILFYTASLMIANDLTLLDRYLKHPSKEPEYRQGRSHLEFVTTLISEYPALAYAHIQQTIDDILQQRIPQIE